MPRKSRFFHAYPYEKHFVYCIVDRQASRCLPPYMPGTGYSTAFPVFKCRGGGRAPSLSLCLLRHFTFPPLVGVLNNTVRTTHFVVKLSSSRTLDTPAGLTATISPHNTQGVATRRVFSLTSSISFTSAVRSTHLMEYFTI